jgi:hypothetical protein
MARKKRQIRIKVEGVRRKQPDTRRLARAIIRFAVEEDLTSAQEFADALEHEEALRRKRLTRGRKAQRQQDDEVASD